MKMTARARSVALCGGVLGSVALAAAFVQRCQIAPLEQKQAETRRMLAEMEGRLLSARAEMAGIKEREQEIARIRKDLNALHATAELGPAVTWFPTRIKEQLSAFGVSEAEVRRNTSVAVPGLPGYEWSYWHVALPPQAGLRKVTDALAAVAQIDGRDRFAKIVDFSMSAGVGESPAPSGRINVKTFVRK